jgi:predicted acetyltransferase
MSDKPTKEEVAIGKVSDLLCEQSCIIRDFSQQQKRAKDALARFIDALDSFVDNIALSDPEDSQSDYFKHKHTEDMGKALESVVDEVFDAIARIRIR